MENSSERQAVGQRKLLVFGAVNADERRIVDEAQAKAGYAKHSPFTRDVMLAVSRSEDLLKAVMAVAGKAERRNRAA